MESIQGNIKLTIINGKAITTSRQIACHFDKRHKNVLRDIENLDCSPQFNGLNFEPVEYQDNKGEPRKAYQITRNGFVFLAMGFTGKRAAQFKEAYICAFDEMESELQKRHQTGLQCGEPTLNDLFNLGSSIEKTMIEVTHTKRGEIISVDRSTQQSSTKLKPHAPTVSTKSAWIQIVEAFFTEIERGNIPETMRKNILIANEVTTSTTTNNKTHTCLFFRASNLIALFRKTSHLFELLNISGIQSAEGLLLTLKKAGVLAFSGKEKEKAIPIDPKLPLKTRRVSHLVAIDLVILEQDYEVVMPKSEQIAYGC
jgi:Rha family phage regulatory protein